MYTVGIDLCDDYITAYSVESGISCTVPCAVCREKRDDIWHIGETAYRKALSGEGVITDKLLTLLRMDGTSTIMRKTYTAHELLSRLISQVLGEVTGGQGMDIADRIVIAIHKPETSMIVKILNAVTECGIAREKVAVISHEEAFIHYVLSQEKEIYANRVSMFDVSGEMLSYYEFMVIRGISRSSVVAEGNDLEEAFRTEILKTPKGAVLADQIIKDAAKKHMEGKVISSVFLTGKGFERTDWAKEFLDYICVRRKVFYEKDLFAIGAGKLAKKQTDGIKDDCLIYCDTRIKYEISMPVIIKDRQQKLILLGAGQRWIGNHAHAEAVLTQQDHVQIDIEPVDAKQKGTSVKIRLKDFPKRPDRCTKIALDLFCDSENEGRIVIKDMGFGEFFPASDKFIEEYYRIGK